MRVLRAGLIGATIGQSRLAAALEIMCAGIGVTLDFTPIDTAGIEGFDFRRTVDELRSKDWTGVTVTHPHKTEAALYAGAAMVGDTLGLGAANTLTFSPDLRGHNTDYTGFLAAWRAVMGDMAPGRVAMAGAGGVARALGPALKTLGAEGIVIWDPVERMAKSLAAELGPGAKAVPAGEVEAEIRAADGLVNATPLGMSGHPGSAFPPALIGGQHWAFDAVYTPTDTNFLTTAAARGLQVMTGFDLFRFMAMRSFAAYTGTVPDPALVLPQLETLRPGARA